MKNSTFLELVNRVCERINETTLSEAEFGSVKNIHATIKNSVSEAVFIILQSSGNWPFLAIEQTIKLSPGTNEYAWPTDFDRVDWDSFVLKDRQGNWRTLKPEQKEFWNFSWRPQDLDSLPKGLNTPTRVFSTHGNGFGIHPNPDEPYELKYRYWRTVDPLRNANDECRIPYQYEHVIVSCALMLMYSFLDNESRAAFWDDRYREYKKNMERTLLGNNYQHFYDGRIIRR